MFNVDVIKKKKKKKNLRFEENFCVAKRGNLYGIAGYIEGDVFFGLPVFRPQGRQMAARTMEVEFDRRIFGKPVIAKIDALLQFQKAYPKLRPIEVMRFKALDNGTIYLMVRVEDRS